MKFVVMVAVLMDLVTAAIICECAIYVCQGTGYISAKLLF